MKTYNRRQFLRFSSAALAGAFALKTGAPNILANFQENRPFEMLALGDSIMWGLGLENKNKFSYLVKNWLETDVFKRNRTINLTVEAHSGASLEDVAEEGESNQSKTKYNGEFNSYSPTVFQQESNALEDYRKRKIAPESVNLILLNGGINDIKVSNLLNPLVPEDEIQADINRYFGDSMSRLLRKTRTDFPNALIVVTGYYPIISQKTELSEFERLLQLAPETRFLKTLSNVRGGKLSRMLGLSYSTETIRRYCAGRSDFWYDESNRALQKTVAKINGEKQAAQPILFAEVKFKSENCYAAPGTYLWKLTDDGQTDDELFAQRGKICSAKETIRERGVCQIGGIGHPNRAGARAYADAIIEQLKNAPITKTAVSGKA